MQAHLHTRHTFTPGTPSHQAHLHTRHTFTPGTPSHQAHLHTRHTFTPGTPSHQAHLHTRHTFTPGTPSHQAHLHTKHTFTLVHTHILTIDYSLMQYSPMGAFDELLNSSQETIPLVIHILCTFIPHTTQSQ